MNYRRVGDSVVVRLEIGEELCGSLLGLAEDEDIRLAEISGLGASITAQVGIFDPAAGRYSPVRVENEFLEAVSLTGSLTRMDGKPYLHMHALLANPVTGRILAGHLNELIVGATAELIVRVLPGEIGRVVCPVTGLNVLGI